MKLKVEKEASEEEGMKVPLTALVHFKEGRPVLLHPALQREQNGISHQGAFRTKTQVFCVW